jgi:hypothetical protein
MRAAHRPTAAETARVVAAEAARNVARDLAPVSVFISRKTQRLYVRQAVQPILESPLTIRDADRPIGDREPAFSAATWNRINADLDYIEGTHTAAYEKNDDEFPITTAEKRKEWVRALFLYRRYVRCI